MGNRSTQQTMFLDITKKPGDPDAVRTAGQIAEQNERLVRESELMRVDIAKLKDEIKKLETDNQYLRSRLSKMRRGIL